eukprot:TRINITY_DN294_c0_g1_i1.p1 TRINITY_DN294_c0_g1~~TRINITY_DN294_c0_g1_i1.p1  ORF type:complete len:302 (+),score=57.26 TRINITY_DN294_c0_g1_i1:1114-2019(+)
MQKSSKEQGWLYNYSTANYMDRNNPEIRQAKKQLLKDAYSPAKRKQELFCTAIFAILLPATIYHMISHFTVQNIVWIVGGMIFGGFVADFCSGVLHWTADTWGNLDTPVIGQNFIRSFREHHVSPSAMCDHDVIETNADVFMLCCPFLYSMLTKDLMANSVDGINPAGWDMFVMCTWTMAATYTSITNQIHKWAHTYKPPAIVTYLQDTWIILPKKNHTIHHQPAFDGHYCITTGWLNPILDGAGFWRKFEELITKLTGWIPREDDYKWTGLVDETPDAVKKYLQTKQSSSTTPTTTKKSN